MTIAQAFAAAQAQKRKALIPYLSAGFPDPESWLETALRVAEQADLLEIGLPFSDPLGDGPVIQQASQVALAHGIKTAQVLELTRALSERTEVPLCLMTYLNPVLSYGPERFFHDFAQAGIQAVIFPDLPAGEDPAVADAALSAGIAPVFLIAPTSTEARMQAVAKAARGFIYVVSVTGVTGARESLPTELGPLVQKMRTFTDLPLVVGFGIASRQTAAQAAAVADGVVVGSALIETLAQGHDPEALLLELKEGLALS
jgi:tryptophan synthase alpha chain